MFLWYLVHIIAQVYFLYHFYGQIILLKYALTRTARPLRLQDLRVSLMTPSFLPLAWSYETIKNTWSGTGASAHAKEDRCNIGSILLAKIVKIEADIWSRCSVVQKRY